MRRSPALWVVTAACAALLGCPTGPTGFESHPFGCASDADCLDGYTCANAVCTASLGQGGGGSAVGGGGGGGGGGLGQGLGGGTGGSTGGGGPTGGGGGGGCPATEVCGDLVDDNCNGILDDGCECDAGRPCYPNEQGDFFPDGLTSPTLHYPWDGGAGCSAGIQQCVGGRLSQTCTNPRVPQQEYCDGRDTNCDGVVDPPSCQCQVLRSCYDGAPFTNGVGACTQGTWNCSAMPPTCTGENVGGAELCDGIDNDCNGLVDDNPVPVPCGPGVCSGYFKACADGGSQACDKGTIPDYSPVDLCTGVDNNCNGLVDDGCTCTLDGGAQGCFTGPTSACPSDGGKCKGVCQRGTHVCLVASDGGVAWGACSGQTLPATEVCDDGVDNDCNGSTDCADSYCTGRACLANGRTCYHGSCQCVHDGGVTSVEVCNNGIDDDCDGLIDCAQSTCNLKACGVSGKTCLSGTCTCVPLDGGTLESPEATCGDGIDNDCNGLTDCADPACGSLDCAPGRTCRQNVCTCLGPDAGTPQVRETLCSDGVDNDCDGLIDGHDSDCLYQPCNAAKASAYWCRTSATGAGTCSDLSSDPNNCGACGLSCKTGVCAPAGANSGQCTCATSADCPDSQTCDTATGRCDCAASRSHCGSSNNVKCVVVSGPDYCGY